MLTVLNKQEGHVTVFLCLLLTIFITTSTFVLEITAYQQAGSKLRRNMVTAAEHTLADYDPILANRYHMYFLDETYRGNGREAWINRIQEYLEESYSGKQILKIDVEDVDIRTKETIVSNSASNFVKEMKDWFIYRGIGKKRTPQSPTSQTTTKLRIKEEETAEPTDPSKPTDPREGLTQVMDMGILSFLVDDHKSISKTKIELETLPSHTDKEINNNITYGIVEKANSLLYMFDHFNCATSYVSKEESKLKYELEYIIGGKDSDYDNLESAAGKIVAIRLPINTAYLFNNKAKMAQAFNVAALISGAVVQPELIKPIQYAILGSWAYAESLMDVKILLMGKKVPLTKNDSNWNLSLTDLAFLPFAKPKHQTDDTSNSGQSYEDYLKGLLTLQKETTKLYRMLDIMELNIRQSNKEFYMRNCVYSYEIDARFMLSPTFMKLPMEYRFYLSQGIQY